MANRQRNMICLLIKKENEPEQYEEISTDNFMEYSKSMFSYWTENDFASSFRKMLTLEQFRNEEMQALYQQYLVSGPAEYVKDMFESIGVVEADKKSNHVLFRHVFLL